MNKAREVLDEMVSVSEELALHQAEVFRSEGELRRVGSRYEALKETAREFGIDLDAEINLDVVRRGVLEPDQSARMAVLQAASTCGDTVFTAKELVDAAQTSGYDLPETSIRSAITREALSGNGGIHKVAGERGKYEWTETFRDFVSQHRSA